MEVRDIEQDLLPYVRQLKLANVPIEGWIIDLDVMASLMFLAMLCTALLTIKKLSTLVQ